MTTAVRTTPVQPESKSLNHPAPTTADPSALAVEVARLETTERHERDLRREAELAAARERAKFD